MPPLGDLPQRLVGRCSLLWWPTLHALALSIVLSFLKSFGSLVLWVSTHSGASGRGT